LAGKSEWEGKIGRLPTRRWEDNIKRIYFRNRVEGEHFRQFITYREKWSVFVSTVMNIRVS
jgi:hypothetical protein